MVSAVVFGARWAGLERHSSLVVASWLTSTKYLAEPDSYFVEIGATRGIGLG